MLEDLIIQMNLGYMVGRAMKNDNLINPCSVFNFVLLSILKCAELHEI